MTIVQIHVPGAGKDWKKSTEITTWLLDNLGPSDDDMSYRLYWHGLHSDTGQIKFTDPGDATAFKLRFPEWT